MTDEKPESGLTAEETAYFESGGNAPLEPTTPEPGGEPAQAGKPEEQVNTDGSVKVRDEQGRFVKTIPFDVFHAEREEHKQTKAKLQEVAEFKARMEERWRLLESAAEQHQQPKVDEDPEPDPNVDIFAHNAWLKRQIASDRQKVAEREQAAEKVRQEQAVETAIWTDWRSAVEQEKAATPDFGDAAQYLSNLRTQQLSALANLHPAFKTQQGVFQQINRELRDIVIAAKREGVSPAKTVYELAKAWGYKGPAPQPGNGALQLPEQLARVAQAQDASRTVGAASGSPAGQEMTLEQIMSMPMPEFQAWHADPKNARRLEKLMGA